MIVLSQELVMEHLRTIGESQPLLLQFVCVDGGDAFVSTDLANAGGKKRRTVNGVLRFDTVQQSASDVEMPPDVDVLVVVHIPEGFELEHSLSSLSCEGQVKVERQTESRTVQLVPVREELFSRVRGMYETDVLHGKTVLLIGVGSGGSTIAVELAKAGVGRFILVDHDRLEIVNIVRHACGISDLGRYKTKAVRDLILEKNPFASVETHEQKVGANWAVTLQQLIKQADLVFCGTDNRPSRILINRLCIAEGRTCIYGGTFSRAYGGHVLRVIPGQTMCYQCFIDILPEEAADLEIASPEQAERIAYSDHVVTVEPGLSNDIAPMSIMCVKIGILELLRNRETTLSSLYEDLASAWFQWLNRREPGTEYADLKPIDSGDDDYRILAWYGISNERNLDCPACGDFVGQRLERIGASLSSEQIAAFESTSEDAVADEMLFPPS